MKRKKPTDEENNIQASASADEPIAPEELNTKVTKLREDISFMYSSMIIASAGLARSQDSIKKYVALRADTMTPVEKALFDKHFQIMENHTNFFTAELKKVSQKAFNLSDIADKLWPCKLSEDYDFSSPDIDSVAIDLLAQEGHSPTDE